MTNKVYVACFMGQGGYSFSWGMWGQIAPALRRIGCTVDVYRYVDGQDARKRLNWFGNNGYRTATVGYSLGTSTVTWMQTLQKMNLACCIAMSEFEVTYRINHDNAKRAVLWHGSEWDRLSSAGEDLGFDRIIEIPSFPVLGHLVMPTVVWNQIVDEVRRLQ